MREGPIASPVGHGDFGLRSGLRDRKRLYETGTYSKHVYVDARPSRRVTGWTSVSGPLWSAPFEPVFPITDGQPLDVVRVRTSAGFLTRAEDLTMCEASPGTFYFDPKNPTELAVHLPLGEDPRDHHVSARMLFCLSNVPVVQPHFGDDLTIDPSFEAWTLGLTSTLDAYTVVPGAVLEAVPSEGAKDGKYMVEVFANSAPDGDVLTIEPATAVYALPGEMYWLEGWYNTPAGTPPGVLIELAVGDSSTNRYKLEDGRSEAVGETFLPLKHTNGEWCRFSFPLIYPTDSAQAGRYVLRVTNDTGAAFGGTYVWFDLVRWRRMWRWNYYQPWLPPGGLPAIDVGRKDAYYGDWTFGLGTMRVLNHDRRLNPLFTHFNWLGNEAVIRGGGRFPGGGQEVLFDDCEPRYVGIMGRVSLKDDAAEIPMAEQRSQLNFRVPSTTYNLAAYPDVEARFDGRPVPMLFGSEIDNLTPTRTDRRSDGLPIMHVGAGARLDVGSPRVRVYADSAAAAMRDLTRAVTPTSSEWVTLDNETIRFEEVPGPFEVPPEADALDVRADGVDYTAFLTHGLYRLEANGSTSAGLVPHVESRLDAIAGAADFTVDVVVVGTDHFVRVTYSGAAFTIRTGSGPGDNKHRSAWASLGFTGNTDRTGSLSYTADTPIWTQDDSDAMVVRLDKVSGVCDDAAGTYTGTPDAPIVKGPDVTYYMLRAMVGFDPVYLDERSLADARLASTEELEVILAPLDKGRHRSVKDLPTIQQTFDVVANSCGLHVYLDRGKWRWQVLADDEPTDIITVTDRDIVEGSWNSYLDPTDVYRTVRVLWRQDPSEGTWRSAEATNTEALYEVGTMAERDFPTFLREPTDVGSRLSNLAAVAIMPIRHFELETQGATYETVPCGKIYIARTEGMTSPTEETFVPVRVRILRKMDNAESHRSRLLAITDVS
jgi:hypothetical protein